MIQTVAVIGGSGFVGRATIEKLAQSGKQVIVLCRNSDRAKFLKPMGRTGQITIVAGDAQSDAALEAVLAPADAVVNMVGILAESAAQKFHAYRLIAKTYWADSGAAAASGVGASISDWGGCYIGQPLCKDQGGW